MSLNKIQTHLFKAITQKKDESMALQWIVSDAKSNATERLKVYQNAYKERLKDCIREDYPISCLLLSDRFKEIFTVFISENPSPHWNINGFSQTWNQFIQNSNENLLTKDLTNYEWQKVLSFYKSDRRAKSLYNNILLSESPRIELQLHDSVVLLNSAYPLLEVVKSKKILDPQTSYFVVWTKLSQTQTLSLSDNEWLFLTAFSKYTQWEEILESLAPAFGLEEELAEFIQNSITRFMQLGIFVHSH